MFDKLPRPTESNEQKEKTSSISDKKTTSQEENIELERINKTLQMETDKNLHCTDVYYDEDGFRTEIWTEKYSCPSNTSQVKENRFSILSQCSASSQDSSNLFNHPLPLGYGPPIIPRESDDDLPKRNHDGVHSDHVKFPRKRKKDRISWKCEEGYDLPYSSSDSDEPQQLPDKNLPITSRTKNVHNQQQDKKEGIFRESIWIIALLIIILISVGSVFLGIMLFHKPTGNSSTMK